MPVTQNNEKQNLCTNLTLMSHLFTGIIQQGSLKKSFVEINFRNGPNVKI